MIIPTFNRALLLERAVNSVLRQTVQCSELIIVDDGSMDNTQELLCNLSKSVGVPFRVFKQKNKGVAAARNHGVRMAEFPFIAFLDSDDHWHKRKIETQYNGFSDNSDYHISHTREIWLRKGQHLNQKKKHIPRHGNIFEHCLELCSVGTSTVMMKREIFDHVGFFDESLLCCEDYDLWLRISCLYPFLLIDEPLTVKEGGRNDQLSSQYSLGMDKWRILSIRKMLDTDTLDHLLYRATLKEFKKKIKIFGTGCLRHGNVELGNFYLNLIPVYEEQAVNKFPELRECLDA